jgi:hypothetical protein
MGILNGFVIYAAGTDIGVTGLVHATIVMATEQLQVIVIFVEEKGLYAK